jgi:hypothetical protein
MKTKNSDRKIAKFKSTNINIGAKYFFEKFYKNPLPYRLISRRAFLSCFARFFNAKSEFKRGFKDGQLLRAAHRNLKTEPTQKGLDKICDICDDITKPTYI